MCAGFGTLTDLLGFEDFVHLGSRLGALFEHIGVGGSQLG